MVSRLYRLLIIMAVQWRRKQKLKRCETDVASYALPALGMGIFQWSFLSEVFSGVVIGFIMLMVGLVAAVIRHGGQAE